MFKNRFRSQGEFFQIMPAEVLEVIYSDSKPELIYGIKAKLVDNKVGIGDSTYITTITALPLNSNIIRIPLVGEIVLIIKATASDASYNKQAQTNYYIDIVNLQSSIHHNSVPLATDSTLSDDGSTNDNINTYESATAGITNSIKTPKVDSNFSENSNVKPLQPYIGDVMLIGRYGQSIRFSTTPKGGTFSVNPKFSKAVGNPITIFRNTKQQTYTGKLNDFTTENFTKDDNIIVLASGQQLEFEQSSTQLSSINANNLNSWKTENWGQTPQTLISSGRIIFNSTQKEIMAFAKAGIGLSSGTTIAIDARSKVSLNATQIELGTNATHPIVLGDQLTTLLTQLFTALNTYSTAVGAALQPAASAGVALATALAAIQATYPNILSKTSKTK